jgi:hypothetical protein
MWVVIHKCMETAQGIPLYSYPYLKLVKTKNAMLFLLSFKFFSSTKSENNREEHVLPGGRGGGHKGGKWPKLCIQM